MEIEFDLTRWTIGIEWSTEIGWFKLHLPVVGILIWWKQKPWTTIGG